VWEEPKAQVGLFNAGVFRDGLGQYKQALKNRENYLAIWGEPDKKKEITKDAEAVMLSIADLHEKNGVYGKAVKQLEEYEKTFSRDANKVLTAEGKIAKIYEEKQNSKRNARKIYDRVTAFYEKLPSKTKKALEIAALDAVARAHFVRNEEDYAKYSKIRLKWSKLANVGEFKQSVQEKAKALEQIQKLYTVTVGFKSADPAICALHRIGTAYDHFAQSLINAPTPRGMPEELVLEFRSQLEAQAQPVKDKAAEAFAATVGKSQELDIFNDCTTKALTALRETYRPQQFPKMSEEVLDIKGEYKAQTIGGDILASIQPIPVISAERAEEGRGRSAGKDLAADLERLPQKEEQADPPPDAEPEEDEPAPKGKKPAAEEPDEEPL
jgi:hypothetical protein